MENLLFPKLQKTPFFIAGPCVIESADLTLRLAEALKNLFAKYPFTLIFKASFDKANRTSLSSFRGLGMDKGLRILESVRSETDLCLTTDIHLPSQAQTVGEVVDILQIPAFLCRQTDLLVAAAKTGKVVNIKKGQFLSGQEMYYPLQKVQDSGNTQVLLTERGNSFGYQNLVVDFRNLVEMQKWNVPVVMDITHACQQPGGASGKSGGDPKFAPFLAFAAAAVGVRGFFLETHFTPEKALSDGPNMIPFQEIPQLLDKLLDLFSLPTQRTT